jgi:hypothetical protein
MFSFSNDDRRTSSAPYCPPARAAGPVHTLEKLVKYIALIYGNDEIWSSVPPERWREIVDDVDAFNRRLEKSGELVAVDGLVSRARSVRAPDGVPIVSDGPYLEAKEHVGSYFILDVDSEQRALEIIRSYPALGPEGGGIELWPLMSSDAAV